MGVFGNSNSLPISLVISLSHTIQGLHWDKVPGDNDNEVAARGILYLLIFQQLGQLVRWTWGYNVLLAPKEEYKDEDDDDQGSRLENGEERYSDDPQETQSMLRGITSEGGLEAPEHADSAALARTSTSSDREESGESTPVNQRAHTSSVSSTGSFPVADSGRLRKKPVTNGVVHHDDGADSGEGDTPRNILARIKISLRRALRSFSQTLNTASSKLFGSLPSPLQRFLSTTTRIITRFLRGIWAFMNPPLWAMLLAILVASIPSLQRLFFTPGTFVENSITSAIRQSGGVAVPLILVVLGANLARNTLPQSALHEIDDPKFERKLLIASLVSRMLLPLIVMAPILALMAKYVPVSILDDPIFVIVAFLLTGAPSALQLAQICQLNQVYMGVMSRLLVQSYVVWILPSTLVLVMLALEVVGWSQ